MVNVEVIMFDPRANVGMSDYAVTRAIPELHRDRHFITEEQIAAHIGCGTSTVKRALTTLMASGRVIRVEKNPRRGGSRYIVCE